MEMTGKEVRMGEAIIKMLLSIYAERTNLPVAFYQASNNNYIWSAKGVYSPLCMALNPKLPHKTQRICTDDHTQRCQAAREVLELCHVGLWNYAFPIKLQNEVVGVLISGQRRLINPEREAKSIEKFEEFLKSRKKTEWESLREAFLNTPRIEQGDFDTHFLDNLRDIQEYLYAWLMKNKDDDAIRRSRIHSLAHEFLLPIQAIIADAENLYNEIDNPELKNTAQDILLEMQKLALIAENMRGSLIEPQTKTYIFTDRSVHRCLMESVTLFQKEAAKKHVLILDPIMYGNTEFPRLEISYDHLKRALMNLIHNAVKYSYEGQVGKERFIEIIGDTFQDTFCLSISNYGIGILKEEIESGGIFMESYRGKLSTDRNRTGSGLGLSEVKKIIDRHNGKIEVQSETKSISDFGPYKTTFKLFLPMKKGGK
jgi:two-component system, OmpR family, phosphate regulon sensor histidine kinase PhoR